MSTSTSLSRDSQALAGRVAIFLLSLFAVLLLGGFVDRLVFGQPLTEHRTDPDAHPVVHEQVRSMQQQLTTMDGKLDQLLILYTAASSAQAPPSGDN